MEIDPAASLIVFYKSALLDVFFLVTLSVFAFLFLCFHSMST